MVNIHLGKSKEATRCLFCHDDLDADTRKVCLACRATYHPECAGRCMNVGCRSELELLELKRQKLTTEQLILLGLSVSTLSIWSAYEIGGPEGIGVLFALIVGVFVFVLPPIYFVAYVLMSFSEGDRKRAEMRERRAERARAFEEQQQRGRAQGGGWAGNLLAGQAESPASSAMDETELRQRQDQLDRLRHRGRDRGLGRTL